MLVGRGPDVTEPELIHEIVANGNRVGDLPVPRFLNEEDVPDVGRVADDGVRVVRIRVTPENRSIAAELLVASKGVLVRVGGQRPAPNIVALRQVGVRRREELGASQIRQACEAAFRDRVVREGLACEGVDDLARKPAGQLVRGRNIQKVQESPSCSPAFVVRKPECLVAPVVGLRYVHRASGNEAELILAQFRFRTPDEVIEEVVGVESVVPAKPEQRTV